MINKKYHFFLGYIYNLKLYNGKKIESILIERIVWKLMSFIRENDVTICIDHFFISIAIDQSIIYSCQYWNMEKYF